MKNQISKYTNKNKKNAKNYKTTCLKRERETENQGLMKEKLNSIQ